MTNNEILQLFLSTLNSERSKESYGAIIKKFLSEANKDVADVTPLDVNCYVANEYGELRATTRNMRVNVLKSFSKWAFQNDIASADFAASIKALRTEVEPKDRLTRDEARLMYDRGNYREKAIIALLLNTGLRISEVTGLKLGDYNKEELRIKTKGARYRTIYLNNETRGAIDKYLEHRKAKTDFLFTSNMGNRLDIQSINNSWLKLARKASVGKHVTSHSFRRLVVTEVANEYGIAVAQKFIGHKNVATTARYYQIDEEQIRNIYMTRG